MEGLSMLMRVFPLAALAAAVVWLVFAIMLGVDLQDGKDGDHDLNDHREEIAFHGVVTVAVVYIMMKV